MIHPALESRVRAAIGRGFDFLEANVAPNGAWPSVRCEDPEFADSCEPESVPFVAALGALAINSCDDDARAASLRERARDYLAETMEPPGVWRYWQGLPPDSDDTSICSLVLGPHQWTLQGRSEAFVLSRRDEQGRFRTWLRAQSEGDSAWNDVDSVVNANVVAWLGVNKHTRAAQAWLEDLILTHREYGTSWYYPDPMDLYAALARAHDLAAPLFRKIAFHLLQRIRSRQQSDGGYGDAQLTAQAVTAMHQLGHASPPDAIEYLVGAQAPDGGWSSGIIWQGPPPPVPPQVFFASATLCTARCVEALARSLKAGQ